MNIRHDTTKNRFIAEIEGPEAFIEYQPGEEMIELQHTEVPREHEGKGIASALAKHALDYAREKKLRVVATCAYVSKWLERHPEYADIVEE